MRHPAETQLALCAGNDLGFWEGLRVRRHIAGCRSCAVTVRQFQSGRQALGGLSSQAPGDLSKDLNWNRLSEEMTGNIRVGLAAGEAIARFSFLGAKPRKLGWHAGLVMAGASIVCGTALWLNLPQAQSSRLAVAFERIRWDRFGRVKTPAPAMLDGTVEASGSSIGVRANGGTLSLMHSRSSDVSITVNMQGSAGARYVDSETGQVTINKVYYAQ